MQTSEKSGSRYMRHMRSGRSRVAASHQQGAAALVLAALMVVFTGTLAGTYYLGSRSSSSITRFEQTESLRWAQESINGFAAANGRLPCPASAPDGAEDCAPGFAKGWLPTASIEQFGSAPAARGHMPLRYLAYRGVGGSDPDLAVADDAYQPASVDGAAPKAYPSVVSGVDLCGKLRAAALSNGSSRWETGSAPSGADARPLRASVPVAGSGGSFTNIAYGIAAPPVGTGKSDSGLNADISPKLESPYRTVDGGYRDIVRIVDFAALSDTLSCPLVMASLDTLAVAATWTADAVGAREGAISGSQSLIEIESVMVPAAAVSVVSAELDVRNAIVVAAKSVALVAAETPGLPATAAAVASGNAGIATAAAALGLAEIDRGRAVGGAVTEAGYMAAYIAAKKLAEDSSVWNGSASILAVADRQGVSP